MTTPSVRAAIVALLEAIPGIGRVHSYERFAPRETDFAALYRNGGTGDPILGWTVGRQSVLRRRALMSGRILVATRWLVTGYRSLVDGDQSEIEVDALVDAIVAAEIADRSLSGTVRGIPIAGESGPRLAEAGPVMFAGVLCHRVKLVLDVETYEGVAATAAIGGLEASIGAQIEVMLGGTFSSVETRLVPDVDDDPAAVPAAIVYPLDVAAGENSYANACLQQVIKEIGVDIATTISGTPIDTLVDGVIEALIGWQPSGAPDIILLVGIGPPIIRGENIRKTIRLSTTAFVEG